MEEHKIQVSKEQLEDCFGYTIHEACVKLGLEIGELKVRKILTDTKKEMVQTSQHK